MTQSWSLAVAIGLLSLAGCKSDLEYKENSHWTTPAAYTTADTRLVTQRPNPNPYRSGQQVVCTEPSPDVAKALSTTAQLAATGGTGAVSAGLAASATSNEAVAELAGRSTALLGLRDGLYGICEAYANGAVGDAAYTLVLSRYGQLMATLFLGQDAQRAGAAPASTQSLALSGTGDLGGDNQGSTAPPTNSPALTALAPNALGAKTASTTPGLVQAVAWPSVTSAGDGAVAEPGQPSTAATPVVTPSSTSGTTRFPAPARTAAARSAAGAPAAIARMQQAFFNLDSDLLHLLTVACINETDPTRPGALTVAPGANGPAVRSAARNKFLVGEDGHGGVCASVAKEIPTALQAQIQAQIAAQGASAGGTPTPAAHR